MTIQDKALEIQKVSNGKISENAAKHIAVESVYLRPGNSGKKWPSGYGAFKFWFTQNQHHKVTMGYDKNATAEAIGIWEKIAVIVYGDRYLGIE